MARTRKTLAEELAELANPAPQREIDPEAEDVFGAGPRLEASDDELLDMARPARGAPRRNAALEGREYAGRRTSRAAFFGGGADAGSSGSGEEEDDDEAARASSSDDEPRGAGGEAGGSSQEEGGSGRAGDAGAGTGSDGAAAAAAAGGADAALEREYAELRVAEAEAAAGLRERAARERRKAAAVRAQREVWARALEARIVLQRALAGANRLPRGRSAAAARAADPELAAGLAGVAADAAGLLGDLLAVLRALGDANPAVGAAAAAAGGGAAPRKRRRAAEPGPGAPPAALWAALDAAYADLAPFRDASLDRWHRKAVLAGADTGGAGGGAALKALNQSVSAQVAALMRDAGRLAARATLPRRRHAVLCALDGDDGGAEEEGGLPPAAGGPEGARSPAGAPDRGAEARDPETFDDAEFYQTLLREFLEARDEAGGGALAAGPKQRRTVDRRASKGRKLRYHVHEKLINFVAPVELAAPQFAANVFANLFGG